MEVTYLMGAGASAGAIPVAADLKRSIKSFAETLIGSDVPLRPEEYTEISQSSEWLEYYGDVKWLIENSKNKTIDEFAKDLHDRGDDAELNLLKSIVSAYFMIMQCDNNLDSRYPLFLSVFADPDRSARRPRGNIKVVTWNYDSQFETGYALKYRSNPQVAVAQLQAFPFLSPEGQLLEDEIDLNRFSILRLNGIAGMQASSDGKGRAISFVSLSRPEAIRNALQFHKLFKHGHSIQKPLMVYAWERDEEIAEKSRIVAKNIFSRTNVLVIVGYSFPPFNEEIDRELLRSIRNLHKIYVQDIAPEGIVEKIKRLLGYEVEFEIISDRDKFFNAPEVAPDYTPFDNETNILLAEARQNRGELFLTSTAQTGEFVLASYTSKQFYLASDPSYAARFVEVLKNLEATGIFENRNGAMFKLTGKGFNLAEFARVTKS